MPYDIRTVTLSSCVNLIYVPLMGYHTTHCELMVVTVLDTSVH